MSYFCKKISSDANYTDLKEYVCDLRSDISNLPTIGKSGKNGDICSIGSECLCLEDTSVWVLGKDANKWIELGV